MSIFAKFGGAVMLMLLLAAGTITFLALNNQGAALTHESVMRGRAIALNLSAASAEAMLTKDPVSLISLTVDASKNYSDLEYTALVDADGLVVGHPDARMLGKRFPALEGLALEGYDAEVIETTYNDRNIWDIAIPIVARGSTKRLGTAHVGLSMVQVEKSVNASRLNLFLAALGVLVLGLLISIILVGRMVKPLHALAAAAQKLGAGDLNVRVKEAGKDELGKLLSAFNGMAQGLQNAEVVKLEKERIQSELNVAKSIQEDLLPKATPKAPHLEAAFRCTPAKELGGDLYDWFHLSGGRFGFVLADVSGKGVPAALHMANLRNLVRFVAVDAASAADVLKRVNTLAYPDLKGESFVTLVYAVFDPQSGKGALASAGHDPVYIKRAGAADLEEIKPIGMPLGLVEAEDYNLVVKEAAFALGAGDLLVAYTDGVTEAMNKAHEPFGVERLEKVIKGSKNAGASDTLGLISEAVAAHVAGEDASDDLTLLILKAT